MNVAVIWVFYMYAKSDAIKICELRTFGVLPRSKYYDLDQTNSIDGEYNSNTSSSNIAIYLQYAHLYESNNERKSARLQKIGVFKQES